MIRYLGSKLKPNLLKNYIAYVKDFFAGYQLPWAIFAILILFRGILGPWDIFSVGSLPLLSILFNLWVIRLKALAMSPISSILFNSDSVRNVSLCDLEGRFLQMFNP